MKYISRCRSATCQSSSTDGPRSFPLTLLSPSHLRLPGGANHLLRGSLRVTLSLRSHEAVPAERHPAAALQTGARPPSSGPCLGPGGVSAAASTLSTEAEDMDGTQCKEAQGLGRETESGGCLATRQCLCKYSMQFYKLS